MAKADERIAVLETKHSTMESDLNRLDKSINTLTDEVKKLTEIINKGKGAYAVSIVFFSFIGAGIAKLMTRFL